MYYNCKSGIQCSVYYYSFEKRIMLFNGFTTKNKQHVAQFGMQQNIYGFVDLSRNENSKVILAIIDKYNVSSLDLLKTCRTC